MVLLCRRRRRYTNRGLLNLQKGSCLTRRSTTCSVNSIRQEIAKIREGHIIFSLLICSYELKKKRLYPSVRAGDSRRRRIAAEISTHSRHFGRSETNDRRCCPHHCRRA